MRAVWEYALAVDLSDIYAQVRAVEGHPGRPPIDPRILFARDVLEKLLVSGIAGLLKAKLLTMNAVAQDGMRVRASAGASSFRRDEKLEAHLKAAENQVAALKKEVHTDPAATSRRQEAAKERVAKDRQERVRKALAELEQIEHRKKVNNEKTPARASTTDPESRIMKMPDNGFRPGINLQFVTDIESKLVIGVAATSAGSDKAQLVPMIDTLRNDYQRTPAQILVDGDFVTKDNLRLLEGPSYGATIFAPVPKPRAEGVDRHIPTRNAGCCPLKDSDGHRRRKAALPGSCIDSRVGPRAGSKSRADKARGSWPAESEGDRPLVRPGPRPRERSNPLWHHVAGRRRSELPAATHVVCPLRLYEAPTRR